MRIPLYFTEWNTIYDLFCSNDIHSLLVGKSYYSSMCFYHCIQNEEMDLKVIQQLILHLTFNFVIILLEMNIHRIMINLYLMSLYHVLISNEINKISSFLENSY